LLVVEGYAAEIYRQNPRGGAEERRAKQEGALLITKVKEVVFRPGVLGGYFGLGEPSKVIVDVKLTESIGLLGKYS
jgi:hypothetical protein